MSNRADSLHELSSEVLIQDESFLVVADSELVLLMHRVTVEESGAGKARQILRIRIGPKNEALCSQAKALVRVVVDLGHLGQLVVTETECLTRHVRYQSLTEAEAGLDVNFLVAGVCWVRCMDHVGVLGGNDALHQDGHVDLLELDTKLLGG